MNYQLRSLIEWAKDLKSFVELSDNDKVRPMETALVSLMAFSLDRSPAWSHGRESRPGPRLPIVELRWLSTLGQPLCDSAHHVGSWFDSRNYSNPRRNRQATQRITIRRNRIRLPESDRFLRQRCVYLAASRAFDFPFALADNKSLSDPMRVKELRKRIQVNLETYINEHRPLMGGRFGGLLLLMPPLQNIARLMVDLVARYNQDTKQVDDLINEMLLSKCMTSAVVERKRRAIESEGCDWTCKFSEFR